ncbi:hypothetical protein GCM10022403_085010 [Streptomyces coacervatus]|uniref:Tryptophan synthase beta chain-like PALP domain-containing protein n=1 Tax=Streptomyces coacervatus TaxID=647381 RepID=A0ABP7JAN0_9ACTN
MAARVTLRSRIRAAKTTNRQTALQAIGNTPPVRLRHVVPGGAAQVLVKLEGCNPTGSYKDRMALAVVEGAERRGALPPGQRVVEYTGGSTGSSDAFSHEKLGMISIGLASTSRRRPSPVAPANTSGGSALAKGVTR